MDPFDRHLKETQHILDEKFKKGDVHNMYIPEILEGLAEVPSFKERVAALQNNSERSLNTVLQITFQTNRPRLTKEDIKSIKYKAAFGGDDISIAASNLYDVARRLYVFYREDLPINKMKLMALEILENLHPDEAEVFKGIFAGEMPYKNITKKLVESAFPDLFADEERVEEILEEVKEEATAVVEEAKEKTIALCEKEQPEVVEKKLTPAEKRAATIAAKKAAKENK